MLQIDENCAKCTASEWVNYNQQAANSVQRQYYTILMLRAQRSAKRARVWTRVNTLTSTAVMSVCRRTTMHARWETDVIRLKSRSFYADSPMPWHLQQQTSIPLHWE